MRVIADSKPENFRIESRKRSRKHGTISKFKESNNLLLTLILGGLGPPLPENSAFRQETVEKRLDLTHYMSYMDAKGRG